MLLGLKDRYPLTIFRIYKMSAIAENLRISWNPQSVSQLFSLIHYKTY